MPQPGLPEIEKTNIPMEEVKKPEFTFQGEAFLNPEGTPAIPATDRENQQEILNVNLDYQMMMSGVMFDKAIRPNMSAEELDLLAAIEAKDFESNVPADNTTEAVLAEEFNNNKKEISRDEKVTAKMSVFSRAVELMHTYLEKHPKLAKMAMMGVVASELAGCAGMPHTANSMINTGIYGMQQTAQTEIYGQNLARQTAMYGQNQARQTAENGVFQARSGYNMAVQRAAQNRANAYSYLGRPATSEESARIESQYQNEVNNARMQAQQIEQNSQMQAQQIQQNSQMQAQQISMGAHQQAQSIQMQVGTNILLQGVNGVMQGMHR